MQRRTVFGFLVAGGAALVSGVIGVPALVMGLAPAWRGREENWQRVGDAGQYALKSVTAGVVAANPRRWPRRYGDQAIYVWRKSAEEFVVFSRSCTDLGCPVEYDRGSACFFCPCHGGIFNREGERLAGPPRAPLYRYRHRVRDGVLEVDLSSIPASA
jgi:menaquinol-cytochrome c reductase iron-sulfur subunit